MSDIWGLVCKKYDILCNRSVGIVSAKNDPEGKGLPCRVCGGEALWGPG